MTTAGSTLFVAFRLAGVTAAFLLAQQVCATVALPIFLSLLVAWTVGIDADLKNFVASDSRAASKVESSSGKQNQKDGCSPDEKGEDDRPPGKPRERTSSSEHQKKHRKNSSHSAGSSKSNESSEADQYVKVKSSSASSASRPSATFSGAATTSGGPTRRKSRTESEESFELVDKDEGGGPEHGMNSKTNAGSSEKSTSMATNETWLGEQQEDHSALKKPSSIPVLITKNPNSDNDEHEEQEDREVHYRTTTDMTPMMNSKNTGNVSTTEPEEPAASSTSNSPQLLFQQDARDETVDDKPGGLRTTKQDKKAVSGSTLSSSSSSCNSSSNNKKATTARKNSKNREDDSPKMIVTKAADYDYNSDDDEDHARSSDEDDMRGQQDQSSSPSPSTTRSRRKKSTSSSLNRNQNKANSTSNQLLDGSPSKNQKHLPATISGASSLSAGSVESVTVNDAGGDGENDFHKAADGVDGYFVGDDFTIKKGENHDRSPGSSVDISETGVLIIRVIFFWSDESSCEK